MPRAQPRRRRAIVENPADGGFVYWLLKLYLFGLLALLPIGVCAAPVVYKALAGKAPNVPDLASYKRRAALETRIVSADGQLLTTLVRERRYLAEMREIPSLLIKAFLGAEDRYFYQHAGVDFRGIVRAALVNLRAGRVRQGGSTITQQVAKFFLSPERTIERKLRELALARRLEARYSKSQILYLYLNHVYLGAQAYGVNAAARVYFDKRLDQLDLSEMALMAGLVRAPSRYDPTRNLHLARRRRDQVLDQMLAAGFINKAQRDAARVKPVVLSSPAERDVTPWVAPTFAEHVRRDLLKRHGRKKLYGAGWTISTTVDLTMQKLARERVRVALLALDKRQGWRGQVARLSTPKERSDARALLVRLYGAVARAGGPPPVPDRPYLAVIDHVRSTRAYGRIGDRRIEIPRELLKWAAPYSRTNFENDQTTDSALKVLEEGDLVWVEAPTRWMRRRDWGSPDDKRVKMQLGQMPRVEASLYTYDHQSGYVLAMVGGFDYDRSSFNRATQACRQPGSAYKAIYYSLALDSPKYSMGMILQDRPYQPEPGEKWNPQNVHGTLDGKVTMHFSLVKSLNLPSIQLLSMVGYKNAAQWARKLGFTTKIHADKALALGASCVRIDETTRAFATFARGGTQRDPIYIRQVRDRAGDVVEDHTTVLDPMLDEADRLDRLWARVGNSDEQAIDSRTAFLTTKLLRDGVTHGIAARCQIVPAPVGGKGGTSSDTMDTWFVGVTSQWATTGWVGDDTYRRPLGKKEASYTTAIPMWANYMRAAVGKRPHRELPFSSPRGLRSAKIDFVTGGLPRDGHKTATIWFRPGSWSPRPESDIKAIKPPGKSAEQH
ncbi:MAG: PBP1A family penicillin-binding protein [Myxococcales bacterium]|nr:PBP1A family penicillin-binding protein [Myxococcales bacterium]